MYNSDSYTVSGSPADLARALRFTEADFHTALTELAKSNAAVIEQRNGVVTIKSRRLERQHKARSYAKLRQQQFRRKRDCHTNVTSVSASASDSQGPKDRGYGGKETKGFTKPTLEAMKLQGAKMGLPDAEVEKCFYYYEANGWKVGRNQMKSWPAAMQNWLRNVNERRYGTAQANGAGTVIKGKELERIIARLTALHSTYGDHQTWSQGDRLEKSKLVARRNELRTELGVVA